MKTKDKILVVVDYQNDFVSGTLGFLGADKIDAGIADKVDKYVTEGYDVIFTIDTHTEDYMNTQEGKHLPIEHCIDNTPGQKLFGKTGKVFSKYVRNDQIMIVKKPTFGSLELAEKLREMVKKHELKPDCTIEICGVVTDICVISNAVMCKAALPEAKIQVLKDLCASNNKELEYKAFDIMHNLHMEVI